MHQADAIGLCRRKAFGGEQVAAGVALADGGHHVGADHGGQQSQLDFGEREQRVVGGHRDVAGGDQTDPGAVGRPLHARDGRLGKLVQGRHQARQLARVVQIFLRRTGRRAPYPVEVGASAKTFPGRRQHDHAHPRIGLELEQAAGNFIDQQLVEGVMTLRFVERQNADGIIDLGNYRLIHKSSVKRPRR